MSNSFRLAFMLVSLSGASVIGAPAFGLDKELGSIEVGKRADLLLLGANPPGSVKAYDSIETIILNGRILRRDELRPQE